MKISKLYIKIFLWFLAALIGAEVLVFGIVRSLSQEEIRGKFRRMAENHAGLLRGYVELRLQSGASLEDVVRDLAQRYEGATVWIGDVHGRRRVEPLRYDGDHARKNAGASSRFVPIDYGAIRAQFPDDEVGRFKGFAFVDDDGRFYGVLPFEYATQRLYAHVFVRYDEHKRYGFLTALAGVALAFGILLYPLSKYLGGPLRELRDSALRIAGGDLTRRASIESGDEIGELARAFNDMASRVERMIRGSRELTAHVSHELRSPLARMRIALELIEDGGNADRERHLSSVRTEIEDLDRLIGRILELSKLDFEDHRPDIHSENGVVPATVLREMLARYDDLFRSRSMDLVSPELSPGPAARARGDAGGLQAALSALLDNAAKYGPPHSSVRVELVLHQTEYALSVANDCEPPAPEERERLFEPFYRGESQSDAPGTGLGLAIAARFFENAGGSLEVREIPGGLEFRGTLPLLSTAAEQS